MLLIYNTIQKYCFYALKGTQHSIDLSVKVYYTQEYQYVKLLSVSVISS